MSVNDFKKALTAEDVIRRYNLNNLSSDRKKIKQATETLVKTDKELKDFIDATTKDIENIQSQVDGNITTWFFSGVPTSETEPANEWLTGKDKNNHLGDLYYDQDTGYAYRFALENNEYKWLKITDNDVTEALAIANSAKDTADSKRRVFVVLPTPPYDIGDIWIKDDKDLYRCRAKRIEGNYNSVDWVLATDYSNDDYAKGVEAVLNQFKTTVEKDYVTNVKLETTKDSIESSVSSISTKVEEVSAKTNNNETSLNNAVGEINRKFDDYATKSSVTEIRKDVSTALTDSAFSITAVNEIKENGVSKLKTDKGFTFNDAGLTIDSSDSKTKFNADTDAIVVVDKSNNKELLFAGYDEELKRSVLRVDNIEVDRYFSISNDFRQEVIEDETHGKGLAFFYVGGD